MMDLSGIISISGRPGLYQVVAQGKNNIIVESLIDNKRFPAYASDRISAIDDISIYTYDEDKPLKEILADIYKKTDGKEAPSHKEDISVLQDFLSDILPNYDEERVYPSDIKKIFQWFNLLLKQNRLTASESIVEEKQSETAEDVKEVKKGPIKKKAVSDTTSATEEKKKSPAKKKTDENEGPKPKRTSKKASAEK